MFYFPQKEKNIENSFKPISIEDLDKIIFQMKNCVCQINKNNKIYTGFFCKIPFPDNFNLLPILITTNKLLDENNLDNNINIEIKLNNNKNIKQIELNDKRKIIKIEKLGLALIQIDKNDNIENFLELDINNDNLRKGNKSIYSLQYSNENNINVSYGLSLGISKNKIYHNCLINEKNLIAPIISLDNFKLIGINYKIAQNYALKINKGILINEIVNEFNEIKKDNIKLNISSTNIINDNNKLNQITIRYNFFSDQVKIRIFGEKFVQNNFRNCKIILNRKERDLCEFLEFKEIFSDPKRKIFQIKLKETNTITDMSYMFHCSTNLFSLPDLSNWDTKNVTNMSYMFCGCFNYDSSSLKGKITQLPKLLNWNVSNVTNMSYMFSNCSKLLSLPDISKWNTANVIDLNNIFSGCSMLRSLPDISGWNTSKVTNLSYIFNNCTNLESLPDISKWETNKVTNMSHIFYNCSNLKNLPDISKWDISNVTDISYLFYECKSLNSLPDISNWNTKSVINMSHVFYNCSNIKFMPDISKWDTINVLDMSYMFCYCYYLKIPDIGKWNIINVEYMSNMLTGCQSRPNISNWDTSNVADINELPQQQNYY